MCGICGLWSSSGDAVSGDDLRKMNAQIIHRGPDDEGYLLQPGLGLAMRRLTIIDLYAGGQPVHNEDASISVVFNGEIFNYQPLRAELLGLGHTFSTQSDTEVLVHGYEQWGADLLARLNGMFAFALWDANRQELFIARDRLGKKPLYYHLGEDRFAFASEIKALLQAPGIPSNLDPDALQLYLLLGYAPAPYTMFAGIHKLPPGHYLRLRRGREPELTAYWDLRSASQDSQPLLAGSDPQAAFTELFMDAVRLRMIADVPVGMLLSGGLDSSSVMACMRRLGGTDIKSFSVSFVEEDINEASYARTAADAFGTQHHELLVEHCTPELFREVVWHSDEPVADPALVPTYLVSQLASQHVKVVLTGEGADELFAGYHYHPLYKNTRWVDRLPRPFKPAHAVRAGALFNRALGRQRFHPRTLWSWTLPPQVRELAWTAIFTQPELAEYFQPAASSSFDPLAFLGQYASPPASGEWLNGLLYYDIKVPLVDDLLMKVDKMSMAASVEARTPFLDYRLVQFAAQLSEEHKLDGASNKLILRRAMQSILPPEIAGRPKHPFHVPIRRWMMTDLNELFWDTLRSDRFTSARIIDGSSLQRLWQDMESNQPGRAAQLWLLFSLALWSELYQVNLEPARQRTAQPSPEARTLLATAVKAFPEPSR